MNHMEKAIGNRGQEFQIQRPPQTENITPIRENRSNAVVTERISGQEMLRFMSEAEYWDSNYKANPYE